MRSFSSLLRRQETGFSYVMLMLAIALLGVAMSAAARQWKVMVQRELEADLLAKGMEIQNALMVYSAAMRAGRVTTAEIYPQTLAELTRPPKPFLRKVYLDPIGRGEWELIRAPSGGIMGVRSRGKGTPIKQHNFPPEVRHFDGRSSYTDWTFQYPNPSIGAGGLVAAPVPGVSPPPAQTPVPPAAPPSNP